MSKKTVMIFGLSAVAVVGATAYWLLAAGDKLVPIPQAAEVHKENPNAIANRWQWHNFAALQTSAARPAKAEEKEAEEPQIPSNQVVEKVSYDVVQIYNILQSVQLDDAGHVIPDQAAKYALEKGFDDLGTDLSPEALEELQDLIRIGLPGGAGEEAARIMKSYYELRVAEEALSQQAEALSMTTTTEEPESAAAAAERYEKLVQLRRRHLGDEIADGLFAVEEIQARHMLSTVAIQQNTDLSDEEKQAELATLQESLNERLLALGELAPEQVAAEEVKRLRRSGASDAEIFASREALLGPVKAQELATADQEEARWQSRFENYWTARRNVMQASLDDAERERQIEQLMDQYFGPAEQERARLTSMQWQSRQR